MKVFVVMAGEYSETHLDSVFSSRDLAERYIAKEYVGSNTGSPSWYQIEECEVDETTERDLPFFAYVDIDSGDDLKIANISEYYMEYGLQREVGVSVIFHGRHFHQETGKKLIVIGSGRDYDHALKSARDNRAKVLAHVEGVS